MTIRDATEADLAAIVEIYNDAIRQTTAVWREQPVDLAEQAQWLRQRQAASLPVLVAEADDRIAGFASFSQFRPYDGYRETVEHSVYVSRDLRRRGAGRALLTELLHRAVAEGKRVMVAGIEATNEASIRLHAGLGFRETARMPGVGRKFGKRLDLIFMQRELDSIPAGAQHRIVERL